MTKQRRFAGGVLCLTAWALLGCGMGPAAAVVERADQLGPAATATPVASTPVASTRATSTAATPTRKELATGVQELLPGPAGESLWIWCQSPESTSPGAYRHDETGTVKRLSVQTGAEVSQLAEVGHLLAVGGSAEETIVATRRQLGSKGDAELRDIAHADKPLTTVRNVRRLAISPDGQHVVIDLGRCRFARRRIADLKDKLDFRAGQPTTLPEALFFQLQPEGNTMVVVDERGNVQVVDWMTGQAVQERQLLAADPSAIAMNAIGSVLVGGFQRPAFHGLKVWDLEHHCEMHSWESKQQKDYAALTFINDHQVAYADRAGTLFLWNFAEQPVEFYTHPQRITALSATPTTLFALDQQGRLFSLALP